jgi:parallel beta-helix repeat protein
MKRMVSWILLTLLLAGTFALSFEVRPARATAVTVYINSDGSVFPSSAPISSSDNITYTFTGDISYPTYYGIVVQRNNTVIDGNGYTVQGNQTDYTYGLQFMVISNATVKNVNVEDFYRGFTFYFCSNIVVSGNNATANTDGIFLHSSINNTIVSNNVSANSNCGIIVDASNTTMITENNATANGNKGILLFFASNNTVCWNNATGNGDDGISILYYRKNVVFGNYAKTNNHTGISLQHTYDSIVNGNNVTANLIGIDVMTFSNGNNIISGNSATENVNGILLGGSSDNIVSGNNATANSCGIVLNYSNRTMIIGNNASANTQDGILLGGGPDNESYNNTVSGNSVTANNYGIYLYSSGPGYDHVRGSTISGNNVAANTLDGIGLYYCSNNTVSGNNATANSYGIYLSSSSNTTMYHNNFMNNTHQAYSFNSNNTWDNGYPSGGNYWSDYNGTDLYRGPNQNETASDGIGDTPYSIDVNNRDNYPLMQPYSAHSTRYSWPTFHHDESHSGYSESPAPGTNNKLWNYTTGNGVDSSPAVADGRVYVGSGDGRVYCLDASTGAQVWNYTTGSAVYSSPAVADGRVYVGSDDYKVYCLDASTGAQVWNYTTGNYVGSSPAVAGGRVYVGSYDGRVYCLDASTGAQVWNYVTGGVVDSSPAVAGGRVYVGSYDGRVYCLDASTGAQVWNYTTGNYVGSSPAVIDGRVYVGSWDGRVYCLDSSTGAQVWNYTTGGAVYSSPAVADGRVYVGSGDYGVYCLDASTGAQVWNYTTGSILGSAPAVVGGRICVSSYDGRVYCLDASTGAQVWNYTTGNYVFSSPAVADGVLYVGSGDHSVYAFGTVLRVPEGYKTIQAAINAAAPGATIWVDPGVYSESLVINKTITLIGKPGSEPIFNGGGSGIAIRIVSSGSGSTIAGITITSWDQGVLVDGASGCKIYDNIMSLMNTNAIAFQGTSAVSNQVYSNIFQQDAVGVDVTSSSQSNTISQNIFKLSSVGLKLETNGNIVCENMISNNQLGMSLVNSDNNKIYHNDFVDNTYAIQISFTTSTGNKWDSGYPQGGNYWNNYNGADVKKGPNRDIPGSDGIGDTPYEIAVNNTDNYPLVKPFNEHGIGIADFAVAKSVIFQGFTCNLTVGVLNYGLYDETFNLAIWANQTRIALQPMVLTNRSSTQRTFVWNTTGLPYGKYAIVCVADPVPGERDTADNSFPGGWVRVSGIGDLTGGTPNPYDFVPDGKVQIVDVSIVAKFFGQKVPPAPANVDVTGPTLTVPDGKIQIDDVATVSKHFGQHYP